MASTTNEPADAEVIDVRQCQHHSCFEPRVSGSQYCDDHLLEKQVAASQQATAPAGGGGTLADLIRKAKAAGQIAPVSSGYQKTA